MVDNGYGSCPSNHQLSTTIEFWVILVTPAIESVFGGFISVIQGSSAMIRNRLAILVDRAVGCMLDASLHSMKVTLQDYG